LEVWFKNISVKKNSVFGGDRLEQSYLTRGDYLTNGFAYIQHVTALPIYSWKRTEVDYFPLLF